MERSLVAERLTSTKLVQNRKAEVEASAAVAEAVAAVAAGVAQVAAAVAGDGTNPIHQRTTVVVIDRYAIHPG